MEHDAAGAPRNLITTREELVAALQAAAVVEHQFMGQYLYAAFSLKKGPDASCTPAQFEFVRRWAQQIYMIARQEMEHLSIVNTLLSAVGGAPCFWHAGYPTQSAHFSAATLRERHAAEMGAGLPVPCEMPFVLEPFTLRAARRFACMEAPRLGDLPKGEAARVRAWGFHLPGQPCPVVPPLQGGHPPVLPGTGAVTIGTIEHLYQRLAIGIRWLDRTLGGGLFTGSGQAQTQLQSEYQMFLFGVQNADSAVAALTMVMQQGEGLSSPPGFDSHFLNFYTMAEEYAQLQERDPLFSPLKPLPLDPRAQDLQTPDAQRASALFEQGYATLLLMLSGYYGLYGSQVFNKPPGALTAALEYNAFGPFMTMFVRTMAEILTEIPARPVPGSECAAPRFEIGAADLALLRTPPTPGNDYGNLAFYTARLGALIDGAAALRASPTLPPAAATRLEFLWQNMLRLRANLQDVNANGIFPRLNPNLPPTPPPAAAPTQETAS
ncbi:MAG TPA: ferritin-like domain-containing protein [Burkholderiaceae bacterium]|nr:ferritin-like domain-containing protein [Burkholderiaceae bacterium]